MDAPGSHSSVAVDRRRLYIVLAVASLYFIAEVVAGWLTNSLALLSDAVHMMTDIAAICLSLLTLWISTRQATAGKTFGYLRAEILGALLNGLFLWVLVVFIWIEAAGRLRHPENVKGLGVMLVALIGIAVNSFSAWLTAESKGSLHGGRGMALRAVFVHVLSDLVGSVGVLIAGAVIYFSGFVRADPAV